MSITMHVLGGDPALTPHRASIKTAAAAAIDRIEQRLPIRDVDVVIERNPFAIIPELGIGGFSPSGHLVHVSLDPAHAGFNEVLQTGVRQPLGTATA